MTLFDQLFQQYPDTSEIIFCVILLVGLWLAERVISGTAFSQKWPHAKFNAGFIFTALPIQLLLTILVISVMNCDQRHHWSLAAHIPGHQYKCLDYLYLFLLLDLGVYIYHVIMHKTKFMWQFHLVHHSNPVMDVSTTLREHPVDTAARTSFFNLWVLILGPTIGVLMLRQAFQPVFNFVAHTEFRLRAPWHKVRSWVFITPNLHHVHHHYQLPRTDCNYGDVLSG